MQPQPKRISVTEVDTLLYNNEQPKFRVKDRFAFPGISYKIVGVQTSGMLEVSIHEDARSRSNIEIMTVSQLEAKLKAHAQPAPAPIPAPTPQPSIESLQKQVADLQKSLTTMQAEITQLSKDKLRLQAQVDELTKVQPRPVMGHMIYNVNNDTQRNNLVGKYADCLQNQWPIHQWMSLGSVVLGNAVVSNVMLVWEEKPKVAEQPVDGKVIDLVAKAKPA